MLVETLRVNVMHLENSRKSTIELKKDYVSHAKKGGKTESYEILK